jgi:hypothetical protein
VRFPALDSRRDLLSVRVTGPDLRFHLSGRRDLNPRPLNPQDVGVGVFAGQLSNDGGVLGGPACELAGRMYDVWSPGGPQKPSWFQPADPLLANPHT